VRTIALANTGIAVISAVLQAGDSSRSTIALERQK
jgi:hypothetical protein